MLGHFFVPLPRMGRRCRGENLTGGAGGSKAISVAMEAAAARRAAHSEGEWKLMRGDLVMLLSGTRYPAV